MLRLRELGSELIKMGVQVSYLLDEQYEYNRTKLELHPQAKRIYVPGKRSMKQLLQRRRLLKNLAPDYVHVLSPSLSAWFALAAGNSIRVVSDWDEWFALRDMSPARRLIQQYLDHWLRTKSHRLIAASKYIQEQFKLQYGYDLTYIPHASFQQEYPDGQSPFKQPTAVYMGNLYPAYDHDILFEAALLLKQRGQTPAMEIIAMGPEMDKWRKYIADHQLDNVTLPGYLHGQELWSHLRHAHVLLFPLRYSERNLCRCPGKTFFYAQVKRPVITTRVGEVPQTLRDLATYVECTPQAFADAIGQAMSQPVLPDVDYGLKGWDEHARTLLRALGESPGEKNGIVAEGAVTAV